MPRPRLCRRVDAAPPSRVFKPAGVPGSLLQEEVLRLEEFEALRLADFEGLYQDEAARRMGVSRQTFGRMVAEARARVARALVQGLALRIEAPDNPHGDEGGEYPQRPARRNFLCRGCGHAWDEPFGTGRPAACPACGGAEFSRAECARGRHCDHETDSAGS